MLCVAIRLPDINTWSFKHLYKIDEPLTKTLLRVKSDGQVFWWSKASYNGPCNVDMSNFPWDTMVCELTWYSHTYNIQHVSVITRLQNRN